MVMGTKGNQIRKNRFIGEKIVSLLKELNTLIRSTRSINIAPLFGAVAVLVLTMNSWAAAQNPLPNSETLKKANARPAESAQPKPDPFEGASIEKMTGQCVTLETEQGAIVIEMLPAKAPESARNFLNLASVGAFDT